MNTPTTKDYIEAAKVIGSCRIERLDAVLEILKLGGIELSDDIISKAYGKRMRVEDAMALSVRTKRELITDGKWSESSDPIIITLRNAYLDGAKLSDISRAAGITRTAIYEIIRGNRSCKPSTKSQLISAFSSLNIPYPHPDPDPSPSAQT